MIDAMLRYLNWAFWRLHRGCEWRRDRGYTMSRLFGLGSIATANRLRARAAARASRGKSFGEAR